MPTLSATGRIMLMGSSAAFMGAAGLAATFFPDELMTAMGRGGPGMAPLAIQLCGALYLAFSMLNWMARTNLIGGVYSRPVAMGNTLHFSMGALALVKGALAGTSDPPVLVLFTFYAVFAILFSFVLFSHPSN